MLLFEKSCLSIMARKISTPELIQNFILNLRDNEG